LKKGEWYHLVPLKTEVDWYQMGTSL